MSWARLSILTGVPTSSQLLKDCLASKCNAKSALLLEAQWPEAVQLSSASLSPNPMASPNAVRAIPASRRLLSSVSSSDQPRLDNYSNYDLAVLTPVIFPLSFALVAVLFAAYSLVCKSSQVHPTARLIAAGIVTGEGLFAFFCWGSCVANYVDMDYSGGISACAFQGWYAGFYSFCQPLFLGGAARCATMIRNTREFPQLRITGGLMALAVCFSAIMASLPLMNATHYRFPKDFCLFDIQDDAVGAVFFTVFVLVSAVMIEASWALSDTLLRMWCPLLTLFFWWGFITMVAIVLLSWANDLESHDTVWGWMAILMHTQQLGNPLFYTFLWLPKIMEIHRQQSEVLSSDCEQGCPSKLESGQGHEDYETMKPNDKHPDIRI